LEVYGGEYGKGIIEGIVQQSYILGKKIKPGGDNPRPA
jgi:hypothetical protein